MAVGNGRISPNRLDLCQFNPTIPDRPRCSFPIGRTARAESANSASRAPTQFFPWLRSPLAIFVVRKSSYCFRNFDSFSTSALHLRQLLTDHPDLPASDQPPSQWPAPSQRTPIPDVSLSLLFPNAWFWITCEIVRGPLSRCPAALSVESLIRWNSK